MFFTALYSYYGHVWKWRLIGRNGVPMQTVTYRVLKVWTQYHFVSWVPRHWFLGTKCGQHINSVTNGCTEKKVLVGVLILASSQIWLWQYNIDPGEVLCPAVLVKKRVCGGCSVSRAHKTFLRSILSSVFLVTRLNILPHYFDVLVTIIAWLLVPETSGVHHFMHDDTLMVTAVS